MELNRIRVFAFLFCLCLITFFTSLNNEFLLDDYTLLLNQNQWPRGELLQCNTQSLSHHIYLRPVAHLINMAEFRFFKANPASYHILNIILLWLGGATLYLILRVVFKNEAVAVMSASFYCTHPINGILVNFKNATCFAFLVVMMNASILFYLRYMETRNRKLRMASLAFFITALLCHELVVAYPMYLYALIFCGYGWSAREAWRKSQIYFIIVGLYLIGRIFVMSIHQTVMAVLMRLDITSLEYLSGYAQIIYWYVVRLFTLEGIVFIWNATLDGARHGFWILLLAGFVVGLLVFVKTFKGNKPLQLGLLWLGIGCLPVTIACVTRAAFGIYIEPHWMLYSSMGFFIIIAALLHQAYQRLGLIWARILFLTLLITYMTVSHHYNYLWAESKRYCRYWHHHAPNNYWVNLHLSIEHIKDKEFAQAKPYLKHILDLGIEHEDVYGNLGIIEYHLGNLQSASAYFKQALHKNPSNPTTKKYLSLINLTEQ